MNLYMPFFLLNFRLSLVIYGGYFFPTFTKVHCSSFELLNNLLRGSLTTKCRGFQTVLTALKTTTDIFVSDKQYLWC